MIIWITGQHNAGKTTLGDALADYYSAKLGIDVIRLDGDVWRMMTLNQDYSMEGRHRNVQRAMQAAVSLDDDRTIVICSFISPNREQREYIKYNHGAVEVYVKSIRIGEVLKRTKDYEAPLKNYIRINTDIASVFENMKSTLAAIRGLIDEGVIAPIAGMHDSADGSGI